jgi:hypothetical protein
VATGMGAADVQEILSYVACYPQLAC